MTYNPAIPQSTDIPSQSQSQILTNFSQANTIFGIDHVAFNDATAANRGKHDQSTYIEQGADPATLANEIAIYAKDVSGASRLFQRLESSGTVLPFTPVIVTSVVLAQNQYSFSFGSIIIKWGTASAGDNATVTFTTSFNVAPSVFVTINQNISTSTARFLYVSGSPGVASFSSKANDTYTFSYLAIGS